MNAYIRERGEGGEEERNFVCTKNAPMMCISRAVSSGCFIESTRLEIAVICERRRSIYVYVCMCVCVCLCIMYLGVMSMETGWIMRTISSLYILVWGAKAGGSRVCC